MIEPRIVQRLRDAAEDHRVHPEEPVHLTVQLADGRSVSGTPLAVEDGTVWLRTLQDEDGAAVELDSVLDLRVDGHGPAVVEG
ncbi:hypothetical protein [Kineococcus arenarius]|uniref:hypothetical protein n=1 Tax=Kineococcus sp. SYSU DK007 TaxID=3383128 RepID=UPI003D7C49FE